MPKIKTLIIDDEALARRRIRRLIENDVDITIVGECSNGLEALNALKKNFVDLIFLDVQMPELNGFEVLEKLDPDQLPVIIFVTAYDKYALKAFDVHAVDYLLKPFDDNRFYMALQHAKEQIANAQSSTLKKKFMNLLADMTGLKVSETFTSKQEKAEPQYLARLVVKSAGRIYFVKTGNIIRIKAAGKYLEILVGNQEHIIRQTMNEIESKLNPNQFLRIHRSTIINIDYIKEMQHWHKSEYIFILQNGEKFTSGSSYRKNLVRVLRGWD